jgi:hypothetical protein
VLDIGHVEKIMFVYSVLKRGSARLGLLSCKCIIIRSIEGHSVIIEVVIAELDAIDSWGGTDSVMFNIAE